MACKLTEPKQKKELKNFFISLNTGRLVFINPMVKESKNGSRKHKHSKNRKTKHNG